MQFPSHPQQKRLFQAFFLILFTSISIPSYAQLIIDHNCCDVSIIPVTWVLKAKSQFRVWYGHTSHGSQITSGMEVMNSAPFDFNWDGSGGALSYQETGGDLGHNGDLTWEQATRDQLQSQWNDRNFIMWSWCGGVSDNTVEGTDIYLNAMAQLEEDYPDYHFIYMTGHLDGSGVEGDLNKYNNQIRNFCITNKKILFDFADIESYDPDGNAYLALYANDNCDYDNGMSGGNWAVEWCAAHPGQCSTCDCAHSQSLNCDRKGRAFWWMLARIAGWNGNVEVPTETPTVTVTPIPTFTPTMEPTVTSTETPTPTPTSGPEMGVLARAVSILHWDYPQYSNWSEGTTLFFRVMEETMVGGFDQATIIKYPSAALAQAALGEATLTFHGYSANFHGWYDTEPNPLYGNHYTGSGTRKWIYGYYIFQGDSVYHSMVPPHGIPDPMGVVEALYQAAVENGLVPPEGTPTPTPPPSGVDTWRIY